MKKLLFSLICMCVIMSCSKSNDIEVENVSNDYLGVEALASVAQQNFVNEVNAIAKEYQNPTTKIDQEDVAAAAEFVLEAAVDGLCGAVGAGWFSWLTSAAGSALYIKYLDYYIEKGETRALSSFHMYMDVTKSNVYNELFNRVAFKFCDGNPMNIQDSIGYIHNEILNEFMRQDSQEYFSVGGNVDLGLFYAKYKNALNDLGYSIIDYSDENFEKDFRAFFDNVALPLTNVYTGRLSLDNAFLQIQQSFNMDAKFAEEDAKFLSLLAKNIVLSFSQGVSVNDLPSYAEKVNDALKHSDLSKDNIIMCKNFFQVMVCSYLYWSFSRIW